MTRDSAYRICLALERLALAQPHEIRSIVALTGGVSSAVFRVELPERVLCVKYALPQLRVAADWHAPVRRSAAEFDWLTFANGAAPGSAPLVFGHDPIEHGIMMQFLEPATHPVWKAQLLAGEVDIAVASAVGERLAAIHALSAAVPGVAAEFDHGDDFQLLRTNPYLRFTASRHADLAHKLLSLADQLDQARIALVHGDVSPKNLLIGPAGPVFIDAECATFGDPAFDIAFLLNHLFIKAMVVPGRQQALNEAVRAAWQAYRAGIDWEDPAALEGRVAALLPALMLARVDGKSPLEYLDARTAPLVRERARAWLASDAPLAKMLGTLPASSAA